MATAAVLKQLGQARPANTTAVSLVSPTGSEEISITEFTVCNTTALASTYRVFHDDDGTTYDETTALYFDVAIPANTTHVFDKQSINLNDSDGNFAIATGTNNALTFTAWGTVFA